MAGLAVVPATSRSRSKRHGQANRKAAQDAAETPSTKLDQIVTALRARKGATIAQLVTLTGWQPHSVRGAMSGALKKQRGFTITSTKSGSERIYKIEAAR